MDQTTGDRLAIRELIERYSDAVTLRDWATAGALFKEDALWSIAPPTDVTISGRAAIVDGLRTMIDPFEVFVQMTHSIVIALDGDRATARTIVNGFGRARDGTSGAFALGTYTDLILRDGDGWLFQSRRFDPLFIDNSSPMGQAFGNN
jgi:ketosteroid isomerase-like protein